jgi:CBS-domain-containing membrane protein
VGEGKSFDIMALLRILRNTKVQDVPVPGYLVKLMTTDDPTAAFKKLVDSNIRSAPVFDPDAKEYIGFLDVRDLVAFVAFQYSGTDVQRLAIASGVDLSEFLTRMMEVGTRKIGEKVTVGLLARRRDFYSVGADANLEDVAKLLVNRGCHRVAVLNDGGEVINIVSQSTIISILDKHRSEISQDAEAGAHTVARASCGTSPILCVQDTATVAEAFKVMAANDITGIGIVNESGELVGNTSASDLKMFLKAPISLETPVLDFIAMVRQDNPKTVAATMVVTPTDTIAHVVGRLAAAKVHRVYVVEGSKGHSVISLTDVLSYAYLVSGPAPWN